ncbi:Uncharacterised protein [Klebsiella pneumoniae]|nr:Uncharacterised protein [Klebsiella pneumoniae]
MRISVPKTVAFKDEFCFAVFDYFGNLFCQFCSDMIIFHQTSQ